VLLNAEFDALLATPDQILIIDVRRPDEVTSNGGFPVYLSLQSSQLAKVAGTIGAEPYEQAGGKLTRIEVPKTAPTAEQAAKKTGVESK
jgi:hypothetical protein